MSLIFLALLRSREQRRGLLGRCGTILRGVGAGVPLYGFLQSLPHLSGNTDAYEASCPSVTVTGSLSPTFFFFFFLSCLGVGGQRKIALESQNMADTFAATPIWLTHTWKSPRGRSKWQAELTGQGGSPLNPAPQDNPGH